MNNTLNNSTSGMTDLDILIQEAYVTYIFNLVSLSTFVLLAYATMLNFSQEIEYIWSKRFSLPTWLYIFTIYGSLIQWGLNIGYDTVQSISLRTCDVLNGLQTACGVLIYLGIQGLLIARAYSLCGGNKVLIVIFAILLALGLGLFLFADADACNTNTNNVRQTVLGVFLQDLFVILIDLVVFVICMREILNTWKLKRAASIQSRGDLVSILLRQSIMRCCFVAFFSVAVPVVVMVNRNSTSVVLPVAILTPLQNGLSAILVAGFMLELRWHNSAAIQAGNITLPTLQFRSVLHHVHQSFLVEMGTPNIYVEGGGDDGDNGNTHDGQSTQDRATPAA